MMKTHADREADIREGLKYEHKNQDGYIRIAWKDRKQDPNDLTGNKYFHLPSQMDDCLAFIEDCVSKGYDVYKPSALMKDDSNGRMSNTHNCSVISFEVDQKLSDKAWKLLRQWNAMIVQSGTPGHCHIRIFLNKRLSPTKNKQLARAVGNACGVVEAADSGGKFGPNDLLRVIGTVNTKHQPPAEVMIHTAPTGRVSCEALSDAVAVDSAPPEHIDDDEPIDAQEVNQDLLPPRLSSMMTGERDYKSRTEAVWAFAKECAKANYSKEEALYLCQHHRNVQDILADKPAWRGSLLYTLHKAYREVEQGRPKYERETAFTLRDLEHREYSPVECVVQDLLPIGLVFLVAAPKVGKSFWLLGTGIAVADGATLFDRMPTTPGDVLYLYMEGGGARSIQSRVRLQKSTFNTEHEMYFRTDWPTIDEGGIKQLDEWLDQHPRCKLVIIDTLAAFKNGPLGSGRQREDPFMGDYRPIKQLSDLAHEHGICILLSHHTRKAAAGDFVDATSGTTGLTAAADAIIRLVRERGSNDGEMELTARELPEDKWFMTFGEGIWGVSDTPPMSEKATTLGRIIKILADNPGLKTKEISEQLPDLKYGAVRESLSKAVQAGRHIRKEDGKHYVI